MKIAKCLVSKWKSTSYCSISSDKMSSLSAINNFFLHHCVQRASGSVLLLKAIPNLCSSVFCDSRFHGGIICCPYILSIYLRTCIHHEPVYWNFRIKCQTDDSFGTIRRPKMYSDLRTVLTNLIILVTSFCNDKLNQLLIHPGSSSVKLIAHSPSKLRELLFRVVFHDD